MLDYIHKRSKMAASSKKTSLPSYFESLDATSKERYAVKLKCIENMDPYCIASGKLSTDPALLPAITYPDIVHYLVYSPSPYTLEDLKCYKGLEAYNQFVNGWVRGVSAAVINGLHVVLCRVMHSQRLRDVPLKPWIIAEPSGKVVCCHCDCMAGLGETCTHVSALLFYIETKIRIRESRTVTQEAAYWKLPTSVNGAKYLPVCEIDFSSATAKKRKLDALVDRNATPNKKIQKTANIPEPTDHELNSLFKKLSDAGSKAAVLSVVPEYCSSFKPQVLSSQFPAVLTDLYIPQCVNLSFSDLITRCESIQLFVTEEQAKCVEKATKAQSENKLWFRFRSGRITASKMKRVCRSNSDLPSQSLIKEICYPVANAFSSKATHWGCKHEETARNAYQERMLETHENFQLEMSGLIINPEFPFIGASPDAKISCDCCGNGVLEVKCPYCARDATIEEYCSSGLRTCISSESGQVRLKKDHAYMYQVQTQMAVCDVEFADFVLWSNMDLHTERIERDPVMWQESLEKSEGFFQKAILPELVGKFYSKSLCNSDSVLSVRNASDDVVASDSEPAVFCYCKQSEEVDDMIGCDNQNCAIQWFHIGCLKITKVPKGKWFCPECRRQKKQ